MGGWSMEGCPRSSLSHLSNPVMERHANLSSRELVSLVLTLISFVSLGNQMFLTITHALFLSAYMSLLVTCDERRSDNGFDCELTWCVKSWKSTENLRSSHVNFQISLRLRKNARVELKWNFLKLCAMNSMHIYAYSVSMQDHSFKRRFMYFTFIFLAIHLHAPVIDMWVERWWIEENGNYQCLEWTTTARIVSKNSRVISIFIQDVYIVYSTIYHICLFL